MKSKRLRMGVVGSGFVGGSVIHGFNTKTVDMWVVDPVKTPTTMTEMVDADVSIVFVCVPTPKSESGAVDGSIIRSVLEELETLKYSGIVVIKSTVTPDNLLNFKNTFQDLRIIYNPEFLTEANAWNDFVNPSMQILGGRWKDCEAVERAYVKHSNVKVVPTFKTDIVTASLLKYTINSWLATKVMFMNELYRVHQASGAKSSWEQFTDMLTRDPRIGSSHVKVPGPDGDFGFGGHCFPKDTAAFLSYVEDLGRKMTVLEQACVENEKIRKNPL